MRQIRLKNNFQNTSQRLFTWGSTSLPVWNPQFHQLLISQYFFIVGLTISAITCQEEVDHLFNAIVLPNFSYALPVSSANQKHYPDPNSNTFGQRGICGVVPQDRYHFEGKPEMSRNVGCLPRLTKHHSTTKTEFFNLLSREIQRNSASISLFGKRLKKFLLSQSNILFVELHTFSFSFFFLYF